MVEVLIPDVLRPIPSSLTQAIRNFAKNLENWLTSAMTGCPDKIVQVKLSAVSAFGQTLRRYTSLNHLAQAARAVLQNSSQISQMLNDLNRVDFRNVQVSRMKQSKASDLKSNRALILFHRNKLRGCANAMHRRFNVSRMNSRLRCSSKTHLNNGLRGYVSLSTRHSKSTKDVQRFQRPLVSFCSNGASTVRWLFAI